MGLQSDAKQLVWKSNEPEIFFLSKDGKSWIIEGFVPDGRPEPNHELLGEDDLLVEKELLKHLQLLGQFEGHKKFLVKFAIGKFLLKDGEDFIDIFDILDEIDVVDDNEKQRFV